MSELFNSERKYTQSCIAQLLGLKSDRQVRNLINKGILPAAKGKSGMDPMRCIHAYIAYKEAQGRKPETDEENDGVSPEIDLDTERAKLAREQRRSARIKNEQALGKLLPIDVCWRIYGELAVAARAKILAVESKVATQLPALDRAALEIIRELLHEALRDLSQTRIPPALLQVLEDSGFDLDEIAKDEGLVE